MSPARARAAAWLPFLRLVRLPACLSPAADVLAGACLQGEAWSFALARTLLASALVYAAGMALNDHADRHEDAVHRPERPLPRGEIRPGGALGLGLGLLGLAIAVSAVPLVHAGLAVLVLFYDYVGKRTPWLAVPAMGLLRALNLLSFPLGLTAVLTPALLIAATAYGIYIAGITLLGCSEDAPAPRRRVQALACIPPLAAALGGWFAVGTLWPALAAAAFVPRILRLAAPTPAAIRALMLPLLLGTLVYTGLLCLGVARYAEAAAILAALPLARRLSRWIAPT